MAQERQKVEIYTDGACSGNPGPGGWGAILLYGTNTMELSGANPRTTNNRMELTGPIEALGKLKFSCDVTLYSDSAYVINAFRQHWLEGWQRNGWKTASKKPVENQDLWQALVMLCQKHQITWVKVKGHADNVHNNRCDELARAAIAALRNEGLAP